jgi:hypothetical protein
MSGISPGQLGRSTMQWGNTYPLTPIVGFFIAAALLIGVSVFVTTRQEL